MKKSFAFGEAVGLTPFGPRAPARRGETAPCRTPVPRGAARGAAEGPLRREVAIDTAECGGEGEELKEAGGRRPPASFKTSPLPRLDSLLRRVTLAGGGPPLRYGLLREGEGWG